jgi:hypothetical protein
VKVVVDVGGGIGSLLAAIMKNHPELRGLLLEQPELLIDADRALSEHGVRDRCELRAANFFESLPATGNIWTLCQVLHDWPDAQCMQILRHCREAMRPRDRLLVIDRLCFRAHGLLGLNGSSKHWSREYTPVFSTLVFLLGGYSASWPRHQAEFE